MIAGSCASSIASATRRRSPPDSVCTLRCGESRASRPRQARHAPSRCRPRVSARHRATCGCRPQRDLERGVGERIDRVLRQKTERAARARAASIREWRGRRALIVPDAGARNPASVVQQRRLADAVRADDHPALSRIDGERQFAAQRASRDRRACTVSIAQHHRRAPQQEQEDRHAGERREHAHRQLRRRDQRARERVGDDEQRAAGECCGRQQVRAGRCR